MNQSEISTCRHCYNVAPMEIIGTVNDKLGEWGDPEIGPMYDELDIYQILKCPKCYKVNIRSYYWNETWDGEENVEVEYEFLFPYLKEMPLGLPLK